MNDILQWSAIIVCGVCVLIAVGVCIGGRSGLNSVDGGDFEWRRQ